MRAAVLVAALVAAAATLGAARADDEHGSLDFNGLPRTYLLHVPANPGTKPMPLVIALHGAGADGASFAGETKLEPAAEAAGMLAVFPDGVQQAPGRGTWNAHFCCGMAASQNLDDVGFIGALINDIDAHHAVDRTRVYATGISNGGMFAYQLASVHPDWFAAIAPIAATIAGTTRNGVAYILNAPAEPVAVMAIHGRMDAYVLYDGGSSPSLKFPNHWKASAADSVSFFAAADGCDPTVHVEAIPGAELTRTFYTGCKSGSDVVLWSVADLGHAWPQKVMWPQANYTSYRSAAEEIVAFFAAHARAQSQ